MSEKVKAQVEKIWTPKNIISLIIAFILMIAAIFAPETSFLSADGLKVVLMMVAYLIMLVTECVPMGVASLLIMFMQVAVGLCANLGVVLVNAAHPLVMFNICAFVIGFAVSKVPISTRIVLWFLKRFGKSSSGIIIAFSVSLAIISAFVSNLPALIVFMSISLSFLEVFKNEEDKQKTGRVLMMALPIGCVLGGMMTPVGNSCMMLGSEYLGDAGQSVSFAQWMAMGVPLCIILLPICLFLLFKMYKPAKMTRQDADDFIATVKLPEKMETAEKKVIGCLAAIIICWILGSFVSLNSVWVALGGAVLLLITGTVTWKEANECVNWGVILMYAAIFSLTSQMTSTGVTSWLLGIFQSLLPENASLSVIIFILGIFMFIILVIMPNSPAAAALFGLPLIELANAMGLHAGILVVPMVMMSTVCFILPFDLVWLLPYTKGYFKIKHMAKFGIIASIIIAVVMAIWFPIIFRVLGLS